MICCPPAYEYEGASRGAGTWKGHVWRVSKSKHISHEERDYSRNMNNMSESPERTYEDIYISNKPYLCINNI